MKNVSEEQSVCIEFLLKDSADIDAVSSAYTQQGLPANGPAITKPLIRMINALSDGTTILVIFLTTVVVLLVSLLCIRFILDIRMERDKREAGMLKALGIGKREIKRLYFSKYILFSVCGGLLGLGVSAVLQGPVELSRNRSLKIRTGRRSSWIRITLEEHGKQSRGQARFRGTVFGEICRKGAA